jgi:transcriptional regulator with XRE-family HTH domain
VTPGDRVLRFAGGELAARRRQSGLSQEDLAEACGIHRTSVGRIERGEEDCSIVALSYLYFQLQCSGVLVDRCGIVPIGGPDCGVPDLIKNGRMDDVGPNTADMVRRMGEAVRNRRRAVRLTLESASRLAGIHRNSLWSLEKGLVSPSLSTYFRILRALEVRRVTAPEGFPLFI